MNTYLRCKIVNTVNASVPYDVYEVDVVAFIPGEVTQMAAGLLYGPWIGALVILAGCVLSSAFVYVVVKRLGSPFVQKMVRLHHTWHIPPSSPAASASGPQACCTEL